MDEKGRWRFGDVPPNSEARQDGKFSYEFGGKVFGYTPEFFDNGYYTEIEFLEEFLEEKTRRTERLRSVSISGRNAKLIVFSNGKELYTSFFPRG